MSQFSPEFERDVLTSMFRHPDVFADYQEVIEPSTFTVPAYKKLWYILQEFQREHKELPTSSTLITLIEDKNKEGFFLKEDISYIIDNINPILNGTPVNEKYVLDKIISWVKEKRLRRQVNEVIKEIQSGQANVHNVISLVKQAEIDAEVQKENEEIDFVKNMVDHIIFKKSQPDYNIIPTGIKTFDEILGGGPKRGYKCITMGPPGGGKTTKCVTVCSNAMYQGLGAMYLFNDDTEVEMYDRFTSNLTHISTKDLVSEDNFDEIKRVQEKLLKSRGELSLKWIDEGTTPSQVRRIVEKRIENNHPVDVLVIDHLRNMRADKATDSNWFDLGSIFVGLAGIAIEFDLVLYAVLHTKRSAENRSFMDNSMVGLSYEPIKDANLVTAVWRTTEDMAAVNGGVDSIRMQVTKHRGGPGLGTLMKFNVDFDKMFLSSSGEIINSSSGEEEVVYDPFK